MSGLGAGFVTCCEAATWLALNERLTLDQLRERGAAWGAGDHGKVDAILDRCASLLLAMQDGKLVGHALPARHFGMFTFDSVRPQHHEAVDARKLLSAELKVDGSIVQFGAPLFQDVRFKGPEVVAAFAKALSAPARRTGPRPSVSVRVKEAMRAKLVTGEMSLDELQDIKKAALSSFFPGAENTCWNVRKELIAELRLILTNSDTTATNDKSRLI